MLAEADVEDCEIEEAVDYYEEKNSELKDIVHKIKTLYNDFGGDIEIETTQVTAVEDVEDEELSLQDLLLLLQKLSDNMSSRLRKYADQFIDSHGLPNNSPELKQSFQMGMMALSEE